MEYRRLGRAGVRVSVLSFGSWVTFGPQVDVEGAKQMLQRAYDAGVNFFDNAEAYAGGESERIMGKAIGDLGWPRHSYLVSTKLFWGIHDGVNTRNTLNRKYLMQAIDGSLERFGLDFVDLLFCHRCDPETTIEEITWTMSDIVDGGKALYWGTSEWAADEIRAAWEIADRHQLRKPVMEQPQYNLFERTRVECEYARLYDELGIGTTIWSPLASGLLTGKYFEGVPKGSRAEVLEWTKDGLIDAGANAKVRNLKEVADELGCSLAQLAIAWCANNPNVSTVILGASKLSQLEDNLGALAVMPKLTSEVLGRIEEAVV